VLRLFERNTNKKSEVERRKHALRLGMWNAPSLYGLGALKVFKK
jgi:hypothetical protein